MSLEELFMFLVALRKQYHKECIKEIKACYGDNLPKWFEVQKELERQLSSGTNDALNFQASAVIYPYKKRVYIQFFGLRERYLEKVLDGRFEDYHYQNQADWPEEISEKQWNRRGLVWDKILSLGQDGIPSDNGFIFPIYEKQHCLYIAYSIGQLERPEG